MSSVGTVIAETVLDAPFDQVWEVAADLERELPAYLPDVRSWRITRRDGERLEALARGYVGLRARFDVVLRPGWCVMRSRFLLGGMAAVADGEQTGSHSSAACASRPNGPSHPASPPWAVGPHRSCLTASRSASSVVPPTGNRHEHRAHSETRIG